MDGNGRWARQRGWPRAVGHRAGVKATRQVVRSAANRGIEVLTLFAFSSENWLRPANEVGLLMDLFLLTLRREVSTLHANNIRVDFVGRHEGLPEPLRHEMRRVTRLTADNTGMQLIIAVGYGGRDDIVRACRKLIEATLKGELAPEEIDLACFDDKLDLGGVPEPDLFVRTGGERRISNFLLWNLAYTELYFCDTLWPDFDSAALNRALTWFAGRQRRYGRVDGEREAR